MTFRPRSRLATVPPAHRSPRRMGCIWCEWITRLLPGSKLSDVGKLLVNCAAMRLENTIIFRRRARYGAIWVKAQSFSEALPRAARVRDWEQFAHMLGQ